MKTNRFFFAILVAATLSGCGSGNADYDASGVFETTEVIVSAKTQGEIISLNVEEGQDVKKGQQLGYIDITQLSLKKQQLAATKAQVEANRSATDSHVLDLNKQVAAINEKIANSQRELRRYEGLLKDGAATQKQVDDIRYQIGELKKQLAATREQIDAANRSFREQGTGLSAQSRGVDAQTAQVDDQISNATITAPIDGTVLTKYAEQGEYAVPGRALLKISNITDMKLRAYVTADQLTAVKVGQRVTVYADRGEKDRKAYAGTVTWISDKAEFTPKTIQTRDERANLVYAVKIAVKNDGLIKRGMYGDVKF